MDIPSFLTTYGGPSGLAAAAIWWTIQSRRFDSERRAELREDIDREQADNERLRQVIADKNQIIAGKDQTIASKDQEIAQLKLMLLQAGGGAS